MPQVCNKLSYPVTVGCNNDTELDQNPEMISGVNAYNANKSPGSIADQNPSSDPDNDYAGDEMDYEPGRIGTSWFRLGDI